MASTAISSVVLLLRPRFFDGATASATLPFGNSLSGVGNADADTRADRLIDIFRNLCCTGLTIQILESGLQNRVARAARTCDTEMRRFTIARIVGFRDAFTEYSPRNLRKMGVGGEFRSKITLQMTKVNSDYSIARGVKLKRAKNHVLTWMPMNKTSLTKFLFSCWDCGGFASEKNAIFPAHSVQSETLKASRSQEPGKARII